MPNYKNPKERASLSREIAREGIILLKNNDNMLPLGDENVAVFGRTQIDTIKCGTGSAFCESEYMSDILSGMENAGINVDKELVLKYKKWCAENPVPSFGIWGGGSHINPEMPVSSEEIAEVSKRARKAFFVIGRTAGENDDSIVAEGDYLLSAEEKRIISDLCEYFDDVAIIVNSGNLIDLSFSENEKIKALILLNFPGMEGGNALADILCGKVSPSGKLTDTVAKSYSDYPSSKFFGKKSGIIQNYTEDIFVGYRYFETFEAAKERVLYPFGYGLSYTDFEIEAKSFAVEKNTVRICVNVKNKGEKYSGKEVVMVFSSTAFEKYCAPKYELRAFKKTKLLSPGESEEIELAFDTDDMALFDDTGKFGAKNSWILPSGNYKIYIGNNVENLALTGVIKNEHDTVLSTVTEIKTELSERLTSVGKTEKLPSIPENPENGVPIDPIKKTKIDADAYFDKKDNSTIYRLNFSAAGLYKVHFETSERDFVSVKIGDSEISDIEPFLSGIGEDTVFPFGSTDITFVSENEKDILVGITVEKNDAPILIKDDGISIIEGGKYDECALYVVNRRFEDTDPDSKLASGRGLYRMHTPARYALYKLDVKKAGYYDVRLRYSTTHETSVISDVFAFVVSNVIQDTEKVFIEHTTDNERKPVFKTSEPVRLSFPCGETYLKIISCTTKSPFLAYLEISPSYRDDIKTEKRKNEENVFESGDVIKRRELPPISREYDFRNVLAGKISMEEFVRDLNNRELASLTCGNDNGHIGYLPERGVPEAYWSDGPVGFRQNFKVTVYPSATMVSSTWNTELAYEFGSSAGEEAKLYNVDVWLAPAMNIHRNPCCGRNFEYHSEDPFITAKIVSAIVKGVQERNVAATVKHFAANNTEYRRLRSDSRISAKALREIYMRAFERVIKEAAPYSVMTSYNFINGIKVCEDPTLCRDILHGEFGFCGVLMTDYGNDSLHIKELAASHDLKMSRGDVESVVAAIESGALSRTLVEESAMRVLEMIKNTVCKNSEI